MAASGKFRQYDIIEYSLVSNVAYAFTGSPPGGGQAVSSCQLVTQYATNPLTFPDGIVLTASAGSLLGTYGLYYDGPNAPFGGFSAGGSVSSGGWNISIAARLMNARLYALDPGVAATWRLIVDDIEIWTNGFFDTSLGGFDVSGNGLGPQYVPYVATAPLMLGNLSVGDAEIPGNYSWAGSGTHLVSGGVRWQQGGIWYSDVVLPDTPVDVPASGGEAYPPPYNLSLAGLVVSTDTYGDQLEIDAFAEANRAGCPVPPGFATAPAESISGTSYAQVTLYSNLPKSIERIDPDNYRAMWLRYGRPEVKADAIRTWYDGPLDLSPGGMLNEIASDDPVVYASLTQFLATVDGDIHEIEDTLVEDTLAPIYVARSKERAYNANSVCADDPAFNVRTAESISYNTADEIETLTENPQLAGYLHHIEPASRYLTYIAHPHWSLFYGSFPWLINGGGVPALDYWYPTRQQHLVHASLPEGEKPATRNSIILSAHEESGHTPFLDALVAELRWIGCWNWDTRTVEILEELEYDERTEDYVIEKEGCSVEIDGAGWTITPDVDATICKFKIEIADEDHWPFFAAAFAVGALFDWDDTHVQDFTFKVYAGGRDDEEYLFELSPGDAYTTPGETYPLLRLPQSKYAGDWPLDHGFGILADAGSDLQPEGLSISTMATLERATIFALLAGMTPKYLRFEFAPANPSSPSPVEMDNPKLFTSDEFPSLWWTTGAHAAWLFEDGPGPRWPNLDTYEIGIGNLDPILIQPLGYKSTSVDGMRLARLFEGRDRYDDEAAELAAIYDTNEGQSVGAVDRGSIAVPLPPNQARMLPIALINTLRETPPLLLWPPVDRDADWEITTTRAMKVWAWDQEPRRLISAGEKADMFDQSGAQITSDVATAPAPWFVTEHREPTNGSESLMARVKTGEKQWASARVWHGWYCLLHLLPEGAAGDIHLTRIPLGQVAAVIARDTGLSCFVWDAKGTHYANDISDLEATSSQILYLPSGELVVVAATEAGEVYRFSSWSLGRRWQDAELMEFTGTQVAPAGDPAIGIEYVAVWDTDGYYLHRRMAKGQAWVPRGLIVECDECRGGLEVSGDDANRLWFTIDGVRRFSSTNGGNSWVEES